MHESEEWKENNNTEERGKTTPVCVQVERQRERESKIKIKMRREVSIYIYINTGLKYSRICKGGGRASLEGERSAPF
jgi:hypothetical protein